MMRLLYKPKHLGFAGIMVAMAMFVIGTVGATAAQAKEPAWFLCKSNASGKFATSKCNTAGTGWELVELKAGEKETLTAKSTVSTLNSPDLGVDVECTADSGTGEIIGGSPGTDAKVVDTYTGCKVVEAPTCEVFSPGAAHGTIKTNELDSKLAWKEAAGQAAVDIFYPVPPSKEFVTIEIEKCSAAGEFEVTGEVIAETKPVAEAVVKGELVFPATPITEYWTGTSGSRTKQKLTEPIHFGGQEATYVSKDEIELTTKEPFGIFE